MTDSSSEDDELFAQTLEDYAEAVSRGQHVPFWRRPRSQQLRQRVETAFQALLQLDDYFKLRPTLLEANHPNGVLPQSFETDSVTVSDNSSTQLFSIIQNRALNQLDRFRIVRKIGQGGFGVVYLAFDPDLNRQVAIKIPRLETLGDVELQTRFAQEAEISAGLDHPNIMPVFEVGHTIDGVYIVSQFCPGTNLGQWLKDPKHLLSIDQIVELTICMCQALDHCHSRGILHRDIKPSNIMLFPTTFGNLPFWPRLSDFGLAKHLDTQSDLTATNAMLGTPSYMAPERLSATLGKACPATDVYALGALLYVLLTGKLPFPGETVLETLDLIRSVQPQPPKTLNPKIPSDLELICLKCLAKAASSRYASAKELLTDLLAYQNGKPTQARLEAESSQYRSVRRRLNQILKALLAFTLIGAIGSIILLTTKQTLPRTESLSVDSGSQQELDQPGAQFGQDNSVYLAQTSLSDLQNFTLDIWLEPGPVKGMICNLDGYVQVDNSGSNLIGPTIAIPVGEDEYIYLLSQTPLQINQWNHFTVAFDCQTFAGFVNGDEVKFQIYHYDGSKSVELDEQPELQLKSFWPDLGVMIGGNSPTSTPAKHYPFHGSIREFSLKRQTTKKGLFSRTNSATTDGNSILHYRFSPRKERVVTDLAKRADAVLTKFVE
ncbi:MAG: protein kinase [Pirellulales bacterium]